MARQDRSAGLVLFRTDESGGRSYLLVQHAAGHWELPKGHLEANETWLAAAVREAQEETGIIQLRLIPQFVREIRYVYRDRKDRLVHKTVTFGLASIDRTEVVVLSDEHSDFIFLDCVAALQRLTHAGTRAVLRDAEAFLK